MGVFSSMPILLEAACRPVQELRLKAAPAPETVPLAGLLTDFLGFRLLLPVHLYSAESYHNRNPIVREAN
jgi:hypothetical protein